MVNLSFFKKSLKRWGKNSLLGLLIFNMSEDIRRLFKSNWRSSVSIINSAFYTNFKRYPDLDNPKTLNEKIQWLKLYEHNDFHTICADKYKVREFLGKTYGEEYLVPLLFESADYRDIKKENMPDCAFAIKCNHDSGHCHIIMDKNEVDYRYLRMQFRHWLSMNFYTHSREWQYKNIKPHRFIVEKLLLTKEGKLPNDYKLHYINGELQFVYVSYDRMGVNDRCTYDENWNRLPFLWIPKESYRPNMNSADVPCPPTFEKMKEIGSDIAKRFKYVRVDFYDVDGKLYCGEITLHHGSGYDCFYPDKYDLYYGEKLDLSQAPQIDFPHSSL